MKTILLADDRPGQLIALKMTLEENFADCKIITAKDEVEALFFLQNNKIDVVVTDMIMSKQDSGVEVLLAAKKIDPLIMVIIITAMSRDTDRETAFKLGAFDWLAKGVKGVITANELIYKVRSALYTRQTALELRKNDILTKYFDPNVYEKIKDTPELLLPSNRTITIAFWDIRGFSSLCEKLKANPDLISGFLREFMEASSRVIYRHGGVLDKFIGDCVMALFGAFDNKDSDRENENALAAIAAAYELRTEFNDILLRWLNKWQRASADKIDIGLGCGIHTGEAIVGTMGTDLRDHFTAIGPHVNLAARIQGTASKNEIRFSSTTNTRISNKKRTKKTDTLTNVKNIIGEFEIFEIDESIG